MARSILRAMLVAGVATFGASAAFAQFGILFGEPPPRPPGQVSNQGPGGRQTIPPPPQSQPPQQRGLFGNLFGPPPRNDPPPQQQPRGPYGHIQTEPLPPPPGSPRSTAVPPGQRPVPGPARPAPPQPADTSPQPGDEVVASPPTQKVENPQAVFSGLDKITGRIINFDVAIGETVQFGALQLTTRACYTRPPTETANTDAFVEVDEVTLQGEVKRIFTGWMFASSPGLHAVEHPIYDLWLTDCKGGTKTVAVESAPETPPRRSSRSRSVRSSQNAGQQQPRPQVQQQQPQQQQPQQRQPPPPVQSPSPNSYPVFR